MTVAPGLPGASLPADLAAAVEGRLAGWRRQEFARRLWRRDVRLWAEEDGPELGDRLGWLDLPTSMPAAAGRLEAVARELQAAGIRRVVLLGMGGSSLAPEVFARVIGPAPGFAALDVLDTTHPVAVGRRVRELDAATTAFVASSKSGTTTETRSLLDFFWSWLETARVPAAERFLAVTDPDSALDRLAGERGFRAVFRAPADVGGRYSALSHFGLAPAALAGIDVRRLLAAGGAMAAACAEEVPAAENPGLALGALLGEAAVAGRDKLTFVATPALASVPDWIEQLVAESTGKDGRGIVPVAGEPAIEARRYASDRLFVGLQLADEEAAEHRTRLDELRRAGQPVVAFELRDRHELGAEMFRWELAVAAAAPILGVQPFDQPDVELAKQMAARAMRGEGGGAGETTPLLRLAEGEEVAAALAGWRARLAPGAYVAVQAYLDPSPALETGLRALQARLLAVTGAAVTLGYGPRFLHSTGQLHKGGPANALFLQLVDAPGEDHPVPGTAHGFARLIAAQAEGDARALATRGRPPLRLDLGSDSVAGLGRLVELAEAAGESGAPAAG